MGLAVVKPMFYSGTGSQCVVANSDTAMYGNAHKRKVTRCLEKRRCGDGVDGGTDWPGSA